MEGCEEQYGAVLDQTRPGPRTCESSTQSVSRVQGHDPRLSKVNLFTLLSLWMELFPQEESEEEEEEEDDHRQVEKKDLSALKMRLWMSKLLPTLFNSLCSGPQAGSGGRAGQ